MQRIQSNLTVLLFIVFTILCGCKTEKQKIRIGYLPVAAELPLFVCIEQGYFEKEGLEVELSRFASSNELGNAATAGRVDVMAGTASNVVFDIGATSNIKHQLFCLNVYSNKKEHVTDHLLVEEGSNITLVRQLKGKTIASFPGSVNRTLCYLLLEKYNVPRNTVKYLELQPKDWEVALKSHQVDAISALEPTASQIIHDKVGKSIFAGFYSDFFPDVPLSGHWISSEFYKKKTSAGTIKKVLAAYTKAIDYCRANPDSAKKYLVKYANVRENIISMVNLNIWLKQSEIDAVHLQKYADLLFSNQSLLKSQNVHDYLLPAN